MKLPNVPNTLVYLGEAIEIDSDSYEWKWTKAHQFIVASNEAGNKIYVFRGPGKKVKDAPTKKRGENLYKRFNRREAADIKVVSPPAVKTKVGRAHHIAYRSTKFGKCESYIHVFDRPPIVWADKPGNPGILILTGGNIKITSRGIVG